MSRQAKNNQILPFIICLTIPLLVGFLGSLLTRQSVDTWYKTINRPSFNPPDWVFAPVWTSIFIMIGVASYLVWRKRKVVTGYGWSVVVYILQLLLNLMWSYLFFFHHQIGFALIEIIILLIAIIANAFIFFRINKVAGLLYIPYILWVSFASYLTYSIFILN